MIRSILLLAVSVSAVALAQSVQNTRIYLPQNTTTTAATFRPMTLPDGGAAIQVEGCAQTVEADGGPGLSGCYTVTSDKSANVTAGATCLDYGKRAYLKGAQLDADAGF